MNKDISRLREWFLENKRVFPWREEVTSYRVWISEVMLQQTQADRVVFYFERFLAHFPTIVALAEAPDVQLLKLWEGLGYYSRAKNLKKAARYIIEHHKGLLPDSREELLKIPGLGPYTANAICAFAFHQRVLALDANVVRVLSRFFMVSEDVHKQTTKAVLMQQGVRLLPEKEPYIVAEALIELGACICTKKSPRCTVCPLKASCKAYKRDIQETLPFTAKKTIYQNLHRDVAVIRHEKKILLRRVQEGALMGGLYEFPYVEVQGENSSQEELEDHINKVLGLKILCEASLDVVSQSFTRFRVKLYPKVCVLQKQYKPLSQEYSWHTFEQAQQLPFSSGAKKVLELYMASSAVMDETEARF